MSQSHHFLLTFKYNISEYRFHLVGALTLGIVFLSFYLGNQFENAKKSELSLLISKKKNKRPKKEPSQAKSWGQVINEAKTRDKRNEY